VVSNSDALGLLATDAGTSRGLDVTRVADLGAGATVRDYETALAGALAADDVDAVLAIFVPPLSSAGEGVPEVIAAAAAEGTRPVLATVVGPGAAGDSMLRVGPGGAAGRGSVPGFETVEEAVRALALVHEYAVWRRASSGVTSRPEDIDRDAAEALVERVLGDKPAGVELTMDEISALLSCYGIEVWPALPASGEDAAVAAAEELGYPVALASRDPRFADRPDLDTVRTDLDSERAVRLAFRGLRGVLGEAAMTRVSVQRTPPAGVGCVVSTAEDPLFGPVVSFGLDGVMARLLDDRGYRIPPLSDVEVADLVRTPRTARLLFGYEGSDPVDIEALEDLVSRMAWMSNDLPELAALELSPVVASSRGLAVLGARARVAPPLSRVDTPVRRLTD